MDRVGAIASLLAVLLALPAAAEEKQPVYEFELSGARSWSLVDGGASAGPEIALERTVIEHWLEIDASLSAQFSKGQTELETAIVFKKPFELSESFEFMIGAGPVWVHKATENSAAAEAVAELEYFPNGDHKVGCLIEPDYSYDTGRGHEQSFGITAGLRFALDQAVQN